MRFLFALFIILAGCAQAPVEPPAPAGYERATTGSGCRETATGKYVDAARCR